MNKTELDSYAMLFERGGRDQVANTLREIEKNDEISGDVLQLLIGCLNERGQELKRCSGAVYAFHRLINKTQSLELYRACEQVDYFDNNVLWGGYKSMWLFSDGRISLYPKLLYLPELEDLVLDELFLALSRALQMNIRKYHYELSTEADLRPKRSDRLCVSSAYDRPSCIISALLGKLFCDQTTDHGRDQLRAMEHYFRGRVDKMHEIEKQRSKDGDSMAIDWGEHKFNLLSNNFMTVRELDNTLGAMLAIANADPVDIAYDDSSWITMFDIMAFGKESFKDVEDGVDAICRLFSTD